MNNLKLKIDQELKHMKKLTNDPTLFLTIIFSLVVVSFFVLVPLYNVLKESFTFKETFSFENYKNAFGRSGNVAIILNTLKLGFITATLSLIIGFFFAYSTSYMKIKGKKIFDFIAMLPIISPPFVVALSAILLFGRQGLITRGLLGITDFEIYGFHGLVLVQVLSFFPIAYLMLVGLLQGIDPSVEEASRDLGASKLKVFTSVTFPLVIPGIANAFLLVFIQSIADFANPVVIGGNFTTIAVKIYQEGIGNFQLGIATALAMILLSMSISMFVVQRFYINKKSYITVTGKVSRARDLVKDKIVTIPVFITLISLTMFVILMYILIPIGSFVKLWGINYTPTLDHYKYIFDYGMDPIIQTTVLAVIATIITSIFSMILAFLIVRKKFIGKTFIEFTTIMALAIPGTIIGLGYVISYNITYKIPFTDITLIPPLTGTALIIVIAFIIRSLPVGVRSGMSSLQQIDPSIEEAASILGASSSKVFSSVTIPMIKEAFFSGLIYSFARSMTLVSTIIFLISAKWKLLTPTVMDNIDTGRIGIASAYCTILIIIVTTVMITMKIFISKIGVKK
ncbi:MULTISPECIES: ABC transporter permease [Psychrilyobacter]|uniref:ABC transporter permease subunit n=1 Tax=Psychrilyobacter piezotolerans TaxID=2293438 RepID=A0ABX9KJ43_9FUSO|nr:MULTISPECIES: iron ABC transporter permease [Psychrilyobacter]MCS5422769.1 iron ABC transporter permease [Psychrilyobacter sp. S5]NDI76929.1 iron ABC transporter permease [Psychrilyobacter piezotolerans]RDE64553.1 iron ABC transporter permease [Psychrilyobacter sp. S5]REI42365.1 ABC transporter permease subunit [Psychrilyobacter piezotolerans]